MFIVDTEKSINNDSETLVKMITIKNTTIDVIDTLGTLDYVGFVAFSGYGTLYDYKLKKSTYTETAKLKHWIQNYENYDDHRNYSAAFGEAYTILRRTFDN